MLYNCYLVVVFFSSLIWTSTLILCTTSLFTLAGPKIGETMSSILYGPFRKITVALYKWSGRRGGGADFLGHMI